ncbi:unnamed protein product, partial [Cylindrotheca closterium]
NRKGPNMNEQFTVAQSKKNHHDVVGKNFSCPSNQMAMVNILGPQESNFINESRQGMIMPSHVVSLRSTTKQPKGNQNAAHSSEPQQWVDSHDLFVVGRQEYRHQISSNQHAPSRSAANSNVTFCDAKGQDSHSLKQPYFASHWSNLPGMNDQTSSHIRPRMISDSEQESQTETKHHYDLISNSRTMSLTSALRSQAIAIQPSATCHPTDLEEQNTQQSEMIYDQATWRMYNRIVDHRKNQIQGDDAQQAHATSDNLQRSLQVLNNLNFDVSDNDGSIYLADDGEIFELDM